MFDLSEIENPSQLFSGVTDLGESIDMQFLFNGLAVIFDRIAPYVYMLLGLALGFFVAKRLIGLKDGEPIEELDGFLSFFTKIQEVGKKRFGGLADVFKFGLRNKRVFIHGKSFKMRRFVRPGGLHSYGYVTSLSKEARQYMAGDKFGISRMREHLAYGKRDDSLRPVRFVKLENVAISNYRKYNKKVRGLPRYTPPSLLGRIIGKRGTWSK